MKFYTADTHFGHDNIRRFCNRPFDNVAEMDKALTDNWNNVVGQNDEIYMLGDFTFYRGQQVLDIFSKLNGRKHLIRGNHDKHDTLSLPWASVQDYLEISDNGTKLVLFHYGMRSWNGMFKGHRHLFGHSHARLPGNSLSLDVGVDCWDYTPTTLPAIVSRMSTLPAAKFEESGGTHF